MPHTNRKRNRGRLVRPRIDAGMQTDPVPVSIVKLHAKSGKSKKPRSLLPNKKAFKMVFSEVFPSVVVASDVSGSLFSWQYNANGMSDPNVTGGGHLPLGMDQLYPFYNNYYVKRAKIIIEGTMVSAGANQLSIGSLNNGETPPTWPQDYNEHAQFRTYNVDNQQKFKIKYTADVESDLGLKKGVVVNDANYWGTTVTSVDSAKNPAYGNRFWINLRSLTLSQQMQCQLSVTIIYYATFFGPKVLASS